MSFLHHQDRHRHVLPFRNAQDKRHAAPHTAQAFVIMLLQVKCGCLCRHLWLPALPQRLQKYTLVVGVINLQLNVCRTALFHHCSQHLKEFSKSLHRLRRYPFQCEAEASATLDFQVPQVQGLDSRTCTSCIQTAKAWKQGNEFLRARVASEFELRRFDTDPATLCRLCRSHNDITGSHCV